MNVVLVEPEIPNNTGNIGRMCVGLWSKLHLVGPLGFSINDKHLKRAGLDYWPSLDWARYDDWAKFEPQLPPQKERVFLVETGSRQSIFDQKFEEGDFFIFGRETIGINHSVRAKYADRIVTLPFPGKIRSFNLANCVSMVMMKAFEQIVQKDPSLGRLPSC